jgi:SAM-dependent methyltransferase
MSDKQIYDQEFYKQIRDGSRLSAQVIIPLILEHIQPRTVVDVGCGAGIFLSVFEQHGITNYLGVDGDYVDQSMLEIPADRFLSADLNKPLQINQTFDLVISLEVAEHLSSTSAETYVKTLTRLGDFIIFSAAIPQQGGAGHINEQWPIYWAKLFAKENYITVDYLRSKLWGHQHVESWYAQNILCFIRNKVVQYYPRLACYIRSPEDPSLSLVHPDLYLNRLQYQNYILKQKQERISDLTKIILDRYDLRHANFIIFPDWSCPLELITVDLWQAVEAFVKNPSNQLMSLFIQANDLELSQANLIVETIIMNLLLDGCIDDSNQLSLHCIGQLDRLQWKLLLSRIQAHIQIDHQNHNFISSLSLNLPIESIDALSRWEVNLS